MGKSTILAFILVSLATVGCGNHSLPTAPSNTAAVVAASVGTSTEPPTLRWDLTASACAPLRPEPELGPTPTSLRALEATEQHYRPGALLALWMRDADSVWAVFHDEPQGYALCFWDTAGI